MVALTIEVPPISRPRGSHSFRPFSVPERSALKKSQSNSGIAAVFQLCSPLTVNSGGTTSSFGKVGTGLDQQDLAIGILGQPRGDDAAARTSADDDGVIPLHQVPLPFFG